MNKRDPESSASSRPANSPATAKTRRPAPAAAPLWSPGRDREWAELTYQFSIIGEPNRLLLLRAIGDGDGTADIKTICERLSLSPGCANKHFSLLKATGLIAARTEHRHVFYSLTEAGSKLNKAVLAVLEAV